MTQAQLFANTMSYLWGDTDTEHSFIVRAIGDKLKGNARCGYENALDVQERVFPDSGLYPYITEGELLFDVKFTDGSRALVSTVGGIGSGVEVIA